MSSAVKAMVFTLFEVHTREVTASIPGDCPGCGHDLSSDDALLEWAYEDRGWVGRFVPASHDPDPGAGSVEYRYPRCGGEAFLTNQIRCARCDRELAAASTTHESLATRNPKDG